MANVSIATAFLSIVPTVEGMQGNLGRIFQPAEQEADAAGGRSGAKFAVAAAGALVAAAGAVALGVKKLYDVGSVFDDVSDTIRAGTGQSGAALEELSGIAKTVATQIPTSFEQASATVTQVTQRLGLTGDKLTTVSEQFIQAGNVLGQDVDIDSATKALSVFGVQGDAVSGQLDTLFRISQSTGVGINELTTAAAAQAPALQELGFSLTDTASLIGSLDKAGLNSTAITASMGKGLVKLAKDGEQPQEAFQRITGQLNDLVASGDTAAAIDLAAGIFGTKGATQFVGAIQSGTLNMENLSAAAAGTGDTILGVGAETADAAESWTLFKNKAIAALQPAGDAVFGLAGGAMAKLNESFDDVLAVVDLLRTGDFKGGIFGLEEDSPFIGVLFSLRDIVKEIGATVGPIFTDLFNQIAPIFEEVGGILGPALVDVFNTLKPAVMQLLPIVMQLLPVFNPVSLLFHALLPILPQIAEVVGELARVIAGALAKALQALAPLFEAVVGVIQKLLPFITNLVASLLPPLMMLFDQLAPLLDALLGALMPVVDAIIAALIPAIDALMPVVQIVFGFIAATITNVLTVVRGVIDVLIGVFTGDWSKVWTGIQEIFGGVWDQIKNILSTAWNVIVEIFTSIGPTLLGIIASFEGKLIEWGAQFLGWLWDGIKQVFVLVLDWFASLPGWVWEKITALTSVIIGYGTQFLQWIWNGITNLFPQVLSWFAALPGTAWAGVVALATNITGYGGQFIGWIKDGIVLGAQGIWDYISGIPKAILDILTKIKDKIMDLGKALVGWIVDGVIAVASKIWDAITDALTGSPAGRPTDSLTGANVPGVTPGGIARGGLVPRAQAAGGMVDFLGAETQYGRNWVKPAGRISGPGGPSSDSIPTWLSDGEYVNRQSSVAKFLPTLEALNSGDAQQAAWSLLPHLAEGGMAGTKARATALGGELAWAEANKKIKQIQEQAASAGVNLAEFNSSQNPASFGWIRAANQVPFSFAGLGTSVAGGTTGLWAALLNALAPSIPGGVKTLGGFENRNNVNNPGVPSFHSYGLAMDVNAPWNPNGVSGYGRSGQFVIPSGPAHSLAAQFGMLWGGDFTGTPDPMHFEIHLPPSAIGGAVAGTLGAAAAAPAGVSGGAFAPLVERWRATVLQGLALIGQPASLANTVLNQIRTESSGNPNAINLTDINAQRGYPSRGLVQTIPQTFAAYRLPSLVNNIVDPLANIVSGMRYAIARYGSIPAGMRGVAYDNGGWLQPGGVPVNLLNKPEAVLTPPQSSALLTHAKALEAGFSGQAPTLIINLDSSDPLQVAVGQMIRDGVARGHTELVGSLNRQVGQTV